MKLRHIPMSIGLLVVTACSGGGGGSKTLEGDAGNPQDPGAKIIQDITNPISSSECMDPFVFVKSWGEELMSQIRRGDAACTKKAIELSKVDVNQPQEAFGHDEKIYPIWHALNSSALFFAKKGTADNAFKVIKVLVDAGARLDIKNDKNQSPLQFAMENDEVFNDYPIVASFLIHTGKTNILETNKQGLAPYHYALSRASIEHLKLMIAQNIDINFPSGNGKAPLNIAFDAKFLEGIELLMSKNIRVDFRDTAGNSSIQRAIQQDYDAVAMALIEKGLDLNLMNNSQETALMTSIARSKTAIAEKLISKDVNVDLRTKQTTPLHLAIDKKLETVVLQLMDKVKNRSELDESGKSVAHLSVLSGLDSLLQKTIEKKFALDLKDRSGETALHLAVRADSESMVRSLIDAGANEKSVDLEKRAVTHKVKSTKILNLLVNAGATINDLDGKGNSPLAYAAISQNRELAERLVQLKADTKWTDGKGRNLVSLMIGQNYLALAQYFMDLGVSPSATDKEGNTPLFFANGENAVIMLAGKVDVNALNQKKESALLRAVQWYTSTEEVYVLDMIKKLIDFKADVNVQLPESKGTLLHLLMRERTTAKLLEGLPHEYITLTEILLLKDIKLNAKDKNGNSALHLADTVAEVELLGKYNAVANIQNKNGLTPKGKYTPTKLKLEKSLGLLEDTLKIEEDNYQDAKNAKDSVKQAELIIVMKNISKEIEAAKAQIAELQKMIDAIESIGG